MWIDTRKYKPEKDGQYIIQTVYGNVSPMSYTVECGWNTAKLSDGTIDAAYPISDLYVVRWYEVEKPDEIPKEWVEEYWNREEQ